MERIAVVAFLGLAVGCSAHHGESVCDNKIPPPPQCMVACDPSPGAPNNCPAGFHCTPDGHCDAVCTVDADGGGGYTCTADGQCVQGDTDGGLPIDMNCPAVNFTPMKTTPSIELLVDRSGSMSMSFGATSRYQAEEDGLFGAMGAV